MFEVVFGLFILFALIVIIFIAYDVKYKGGSPTAPASTARKRSDSAFAKVVESILNLVYIIRGKLYYYKGKYNKDKANHMFQVRLSGSSDAIFFSIYQVLNKCGAQIECHCPQSIQDVLVGNGLDYSLPVPRLVFKALRISKHQWHIQDIDRAKRILQSTLNDMYLSGEILYPMHEGVSGRVPFLVVDEIRNSQDYINIYVFAAVTSEVEMYVDRVLAQTNSFAYDELKFDDYDDEF